MRLIDADALADALFDKRKNYPQWVAEVIGNMPDAIVRCKDCIFPKNGICHNAKTFGALVKDDWFCADGKHK